MSVVLLTVILVSTVLQEPDPPGALAGPRVAQSAKIATIVQRDLEGKVKRPEVPPEQAAAGALELDGVARANVDEVFAKRALVLDQFVGHNLGLLTRAVGVESAPGREKLLLALEVFQKLEPLRTKGPLDAQVRATLPEAARGAFDRLLSEYWDAIAAEGRRAQPKPKPRFAAVAEEKLASLGREIEAAYKRSEKSGGVLYAYLFGEMTLTREQEGKLRELCSVYAAKGIDNLEKKEQLAFFAAATAIWDKEQRPAFVKKLQGKK
jgi:hypothetical protein